MTTASPTSRKLVILACALSFFGPAVMIFLINVLFLRDSVVPDIVERPVVSDSSVITLLELDKILLSMAIGLGVGSLWLYRRPLRRRFQGLALGILLCSLATGFASIYSGLRFLFDMGQQLQYVSFNFELLRQRFYSQGIFLILQLSFLCLSATSYFFLRDRRHDGRVQ